MRYPPDNSAPVTLVRDAEPRDIAAIVGMGEQFFNAARWNEVAQWCPDSIAATLGRMIDEPSAILLVVESVAGVVGMAGALIYPAYFNAAQMLGSELFWWVDPEHRGCGLQLVEAMEARAVSLGAVAFVMGAVATERPDVMARLYARRGYRPAEQTFIKEL